jgi:hypothetical protein
MALDRRMSFLTADQKRDSEAAMAADPQKRFIFDSQNAPTYDNCPVCFETFVEGDELVSLNCSHNVHFVCWNGVRARVYLFLASLYSELLRL